MVYYSVSGYNEDMFLVGIIRWWYGQGWSQRLQIIKKRIIRTSDFFSIGLLAETIFSPYKQISAGAVRGSFGVEIRSFFDRTLSRIIGAIMRLFVIFAGLIVIIVQSLIGIVVLVGWAFVPIMPITGLLIWSVGWVPLWQ